MDCTMDGKKIQSVSWPDSGNDLGRFLPSGEGYGDLHLSAKSHGDRDEFWVVVTKGGKETARHNVRYIESVVWAD